MFDLIIELSELSPISLIIATHDMDLASKLDISFSLDK
jgi:ABC-type lipoprotein export system ATPase subunit